MFWASTVANSCAFRIATAISLANSSSRSWSARSQWRVAGRCPTSTPSSSAPDWRTARTGSDSPGIRPRREACRIDEQDRGSRSSRTPNGRRSPLGRRGTRRRHAARRSRWRPGCGRARGCGARGRGESVVAVGQAGELVLAGHGDRRREVARRNAVDGRRDRPQRTDQVGGEKVGEEHPDERGRDDREEQDSTERFPSRAALPVSSTMIPNAARGRTAAAIRPTVSRVRNDRLSPKLKPGSSS